MNPELKQKWITALRSGEYAQTPSILYDPQDNAYCCLGVLCDLSSRYYGNGHWQHTPEDYIGFFEGERLMYAKLSQRLLDWAGLAFDAHDALIEKNDTGASFEDIARYIEEEL